VDTMKTPSYYIVTSHFETIVERVIICNILSFLLHPCFGMVWIVVGHFVFQYMDIIR
jgi:hypothetical protein